MTSNFLRNGFLKPAKHQRFEYRPLYYDAKKEGLQARVTDALREKAIAEGEVGTAGVRTEYTRQRMSDAFRRNMSARGGQAAEVQGQKMRSRAIFIAVLFFLSYIAYFILS